MVKTYPITLLLSSLAFAVSAQAQPDLTIVAAESGNFQVGGCSQFSPKYSYATSVPGRCRSTIQLWVKNIGTAPTSGPITVTDTMMDQEPMAATVLSTTAPSGWTCTTTSRMNGVSCTTNNVIAPGQTVPITLSVLMEDFARVGLNNTATVSGGGDTNAANNSVFDNNITFPPPGGYQVPRELFTIHSVPEGKTVLVDGVLVTTPHTFAYESDSLFMWHTIQGNNDPNFQFFVPGQGVNTNGFLFDSNMFGGGPIQLVQTPQDIFAGTSYGTMTGIYQP